MKDTGYREEFRGTRAGSTRSGTGVALACALAVMLSSPLALADTDVPSANGHDWDVQDNTGADDGGIDDGGDDAFDDWGMLRLRTLDAGGTSLTSNQELSGFGLTHDGSRSFATTSPVVVDDILVSRSLVFPSGTDYGRYVDSFTNTGAATRQIQLAWGGDLGSNGSTVISRTSSGDFSIDAADTWALTIENSSSDPNGPATDPPIGYVFQSANNGAFNATGEYDNTPFDNPWPGNGNDDISFVFDTLTIEPGETVRFAYFLYRGLEEETTGPLGQTPAAGEEIALAETVLADLAANPDFTGLTQGEIESIVNFDVQASAKTIPTLSTWMLLLLTSLTGLAGLKHLRRRHR